MANAKKNLVFHFGIGRHASFPQKPVVKEARLKDPRYRQNKRFHEFLNLKDHTASLKEKKKASKASGGLPGAPFQKEGGKKSSGGSANTSRASTPVSERSFKVTGSSSKKSLGKIYSFSI